MINGKLSRNPRETFVLCVKFQKFTFVKLNEAISLGFNPKLITHVSSNDAKALCSIIRTFKALYNLLIYNNNKAHLFSIKNLNANITFFV